MIECFSKYNINTFQITLDGSEERHNKIRREKGNKSFEIITNNINKIITRNVNSTVILRINYDKKTLLDIEDIVYKFKGLKNNKRFIFDFQRVWQVFIGSEENELLKKKILRFQSLGFNVRTPKYRPSRFYSCYADKKTMLY